MTGSMLFGLQHKACKLADFGQNGVLDFFRLMADHDEYPLRLQSLRSSTDVCN